MLAPPQAPPSSEADPIRSAQQTFRRVLDALAQPGQVQQLAAHPALAGTFGDRPHLRWPASLLLMLVDHEVSLAVTLATGGEELESAVRRRTRVATSPVERADTIVCDVDTLTPDLVTAIRRGSLEYPDDGAILLLLVDDLLAGGQRSVTLSGPGIDGTRRIALPGFTPETLAAREEAVAAYPMGIDILILDRQGRLIGLPRTTVVTLGTPTSSGTEEA
ncbi:MAG: phosphonate C-P lyase system protein PhnH [Thermomicrobiales bacterium]